MLTCRISTGCCDVQRVKALNKRAEEKYPLLKDVCGKDGTAVIKKKIMMLFVNASKSEALPGSCSAVGHALPYFLGWPQPLTGQKSRFVKQASSPCCQRLAGVLTRISTLPPMPCNHGHALQRQACKFPAKEGTDLEDTVCAGARKRQQNGIEEAPRSIVTTTTSQRHAPNAAAAEALAPAPPVARRAIEKPPEQPHVQFPDDSPCMARGATPLLICQVRSAATNMHQPHMISAPALDLEAASTPERKSFDLVACLDTSHPPSI